MRNRILRTLIIVTGIVMTLIGIIPLTPLIWLLVVFQVNIALPFRLQFWQTQSIGLALAAAGITLLWLADRRR